jgi:hypothetical protein
MKLLPGLLTKNPVSGAGIALFGLLCMSVASCQEDPISSTEKPLTAGNHADEQASSTMSKRGIITMSRIGQPETPPIVFENRRYEQVMNGESQGLPQRTGYLAVFNAASNERITEIKVYDVNFNPDLEADVQDVFFTSMELDHAGRRILIYNERGKGFAVDLDSFTVTPQD